MNTAIDSPLILLKVKQVCGDYYLAVLDTSKPDNGNFVPAFVFDRNGDFFKSEIWKGHIVSRYEGADYERLASFHSRSLNLISAAIKGNGVVAAGKVRQPEEVAE